MSSGKEISQRSSPSGVQPLFQLFFLTKMVCSFWLLHFLLFCLFGVFKIFSTTFFSFPGKLADVVLGYDSAKEYKV